MLLWIVVAIKLLYLKVWFQNWDWKLLCIHILTHLGGSRRMSNKRAPSSTVPSNFSLKRSMLTIWHVMWFLWVSVPILGNLYLWDRDAIYYHWQWKYQFMKDGKEFIVNPRKIHDRVSLVTAMQAKRLVNAYKIFNLLMLRENTRDCIME